jgi:hypothetical protein
LPNGVPMMSGKNLNHLNRIVLCRKITIGFGQWGSGDFSGVEGEIERAADDLHFVASGGMSGS